MAKALQLTRSPAQYAYIPNSSQQNLRLNSDFTIECQFLTHDNTLTQNLLAKWQTLSLGGNERQWSFAYISDFGGGLQLGISHDGTYDNATNVNVDWGPSNDVAYYLAVVYDHTAGTATFYVDGHQIGSPQSGLTTQDVLDGTEAVCVGTCDQAFGGSATENLDGWIRRIRVWNTKRTQTDIQNNLGVTLVGNESNLVACWDLNGDYLDKTASGNTLTPVNSPQFIDIDDPSISMAIAFDTATNGGSSGTSSLSFSHTCTGSNLVLLVGVVFTGGDHVSTAKYNSVSMSLVNKIQRVDATGRWLYLFELTNPATGSNTVLINTDGATATLLGFAASYTGCQQSGQPEANNTGSSNTTALTVSLTTTTNNDWLAGTFFTHNNTISAGTGTTQRVADAGGSGMYDSNGAKSPAGSYSLQVTTSPADDLAGVICALIPAAQPSSIASVAGIAQASIASVEGVAIASVQSVSGIPNS